MQTFLEMTFREHIWSHSTSMFFSSLELLSVHYLWLVATVALTNWEVNAIATNDKIGAPNTYQNVQIITLWHLLFQEVLYCSIGIRLKRAFLYISISFNLAWIWLGKFFDQNVGLSLNFKQTSLVVLFCVHCITRVWVETSVACETLLIGLGMNLQHNLILSKSTSDRVAAANMRRIFLFKEDWRGEAYSGTWKLVILPLFISETFYEHSSFHFTGWCLNEYIFNEAHDPSSNLISKRLLFEWIQLHLILR